MSVAAFKSAVDIVARYADIRAKDADPRSKVGIQVDIKGNMTLIAGSKDGGILYRVTGIDIEYVDVPFIYAVDAKTLLQAAKVLKGKSSVKFIVNPDGLTIQTSDGGSISLKYSCSIADAGFLPKPKHQDSWADVSGDAWQQLYRIIPCVDPLAIEPPVISCNDGNVDIVSVATGGRPAYVRYSTSGGGDTKSVATSLSFWDALKVLQGDGKIIWGNDGVMAKTDNIECWGPAMKFSHGSSNDATNALQWPILATSGRPVASFSMQRTSLVDIIRGVIPSDDVDQYGRITIEIGEGSVAFRGFGDEGGVTVPVKTVGKSMRSLRAEYLMKVLRASVGKNVTISVYNAPPIVVTSDEMSGWTLLVAPVALG